MHRSSITNWLNGPRDYDEGVALYQQHGDSTATKQLLAKYNNSFTHSKLLEVMRQLVQLPTTTSSSPASPAPARTGKAIDPGAMPTELQQYHKTRIVPVLKKRASLISLLEHGSDADRASWAGEIMQLTDQLDGLYKPINHWRNTGQLPTAPKETALSMATNRQRLKMKMSRAKKNGNTQALETATAELEELEARMEQLTV